jgi:adenylate cyclase
VGTETERKFLVTGDGWRDSVVTSTRYRQGYLTDAKGRCSVRVRIGDGEARLNVKGATIGVSRSEYEYPIPLDDAEEMLDTLCAGPLVEKTRHLVEHGGRRWEVDVFEGDNAGLIVAEIELDHAHERFDVPPWVGEDVSHDARYYNAALVRMPYASWGAP